MKMPVLSPRHTRLENDEEGKPFTSNKIFSSHSHSHSHSHTHRIHISRSALRRLSRSSSAPPTHKHMRSISLPLDIQFPSAANPVVMAGKLHHALDGSRPRSDESGAPQRIRWASRPGSDSISIWESPRPAPSPPSYASRHSPKSKPTTSNTPVTKSTPTRSPPTKPMPPKSSSPRPTPAKPMAQSRVSKDVAAPSHIDLPNPSISTSPKIRFSEDSEPRPSYSSDRPSLHEKKTNLAPGVDTKAEKRLTLATVPDQMDQDGLLEWLAQEKEAENEQVQERKVREVKKEVNELRDLINKCNKRISTMVNHLGDEDPEAGLYDCTQDFDAPLTSWQLNIMVENHAFDQPATFSDVPGKVRDDCLFDQVEILRRAGLLDRSDPLSDVQRKALNNICLLTERCNRLQKALAKSTKRVEDYESEPYTSSRPVRAFPEVHLELNGEPELLGSPNGSEEGNEENGYIVEAIHQLLTPTPPASVGRASCRVSTLHEELARTELDSSDLPKFTMKKFRNSSGGESGYGSVDYDEDEPEPVPWHDLWPTSFLEPPTPEASMGPDVPILERPALPENAEETIKTHQRREKHDKKAPAPEQVKPTIRRPRMQSTPCARYGSGSQPSNTATPPGSSTQTSRRGSIRSSISSSQRKPSDALTEDIMRQTMKRMSSAPLLTTMSTTHDDGVAEEDGETDDHSVSETSANLGSRTQHRGSWRPARKPVKANEPPDTAPLYSLNTQMFFRPPPPPPSKSPDMPPELPQKSPARAHSHSRSHTMHPHVPHVGKSSLRPRAVHTQTTHIARQAMRQVKSDSVLKAHVPKKSMGDALLHKCSIPRRFSSLKHTGSNLCF